MKLGSPVGEGSAALHCFASHVSSVDENGPTDFADERIRTRATLPSGSDTSTRTSDAGSEPSRSFTSRRARESQALRVRFTKSTCFCGVPGGRDSFGSSSSASMARACAVASSPSTRCRKPSSKRASERSFTGRSGVDR